MKLFVVCPLILVFATCVHGQVLPGDQLDSVSPSESSSSFLQTDSDSTIEYLYRRLEEQDRKIEELQQANAQIKQLAEGASALEYGLQKLETGVQKLSKNLKVTTADKDWGIAVFGSIVGEMVFAEQRPVIPSGIVLLSPKFGNDLPTVEVHGRQSSLGAAFMGPEINGFKTGGLFLTNFYGEDYLADLPGFFIARGYGEMKNDFWRFVIGTEADVINPLRPNMLDFNAGGGAGNMGFFRGQFRVERYVYFGDNQLTTQVALGNPITTSFNGNVRNLVEDNGWPNVDMRVAIGLGPKCQRLGGESRAFDLGMSGVLGQIRRIGTPTTVFDVWAVGVDARMACTDRMGFQGEFFHGQAIGNYNAGIIQIFNPLTLQPIRSTGGWGEIYYYWTPRLHSHIGFGIDDPLDSTLGPALPTRNAFAFANIICDITKNLEVGFEVDRWETDYTAAPALGPLEPGDNDAMVYRTRVSLKF